MKNGYINPIYKLSLNDVSKAPAKISYSQWSMFENVLNNGNYRILIN